MSKFSIESIIIEKSEKDIQTGVTREFSDGINLICGNNEAGKSSLLAFLRQGFFKTKGVDKGKIFFKIQNETGEKHYRTDIQDNRNSDLRCKIFDENNNPVSYNFIENTINKKYFEQGFTINLDDLMNIQNKDTKVLIDAIKDPSGETLTLIINKIKNETKKILGDNNRLTKETAGILEEINQQNHKINELTDLETKYNAAIREINEINEELAGIHKQEELLNIIEKIKELNYKLNDVTEQKNIVVLNFNENLINNQERYAKIIQNAGKTEANNKVLQKNLEKIKELNMKIAITINRLKNDFLLDFQLEDVENFVVDYKVLRDVKNILDKRSEPQKELIAAKQNKENIEDNLLRLKHEITPIEENQNENVDIQQLKDLYEFISEYSAKLKYLKEKIEDNEKSKKLNATGILTSKSLFFLFILLFALTTVISFLSFYNNLPQAGIFAVIMAIFLLIGIIALKISGFTDSLSAEKERLEEQMNSIAAILKDRIKEYYEKIKDIESSYLPSKVDDLKTEIFNKIQNYERTGEIIAKNKADTAYNTEKLAIVNDKIKQLQDNIDAMTQEAETLVKSLNNKIDIPLGLYLECVDIIKDLKEYISELNVLSKDTEIIELENNQIYEEFNSFIAEMKLNPPLGENHSENVKYLRALNEKNNELKNNIDILNSQITDINRQITKLEDEKNAFGEILNDDISIEELSDLKKEKLTRKKEAEFQKLQLEAFEGLNDLKIKKAVLLDEYRKKIFILTKNKMILEIIKNAQAGFDKVQPDLRQAQKYLELLTAGKYSKINTDLEEISNNETGMTKKWIELSRGTKEQVYLALRLGYASNYTKDKITMADNGKADLPVIIDDAFVNFDEKRTRQGIKCLIEFAKNNQILFFTCHSDVMARHFEELCNEAEVKLNIINI